MKTTAAALKTELVSNAGSYDAQQAALARIFQVSSFALLSRSSDQDDIWRKAQPS